MSRKRIFVIMGISIVGLVFLIGGSLYRFDHYFSFTTEDPFLSDRQMQDNFMKLQVDFERLVQMSNEDSNVVRIASDFTRPSSDESQQREESKRGLSNDRWNEYRRLFKQAGAHYGINRGDDGSVMFDVTCRGWALNSDCKGFGYLPNDPSPEEMRDSLDSGNINADDKHRIVYKKIKDHWYIYRWIWG